MTESENRRSNKLSKIEELISFISNPETTVKDVIDYPNITQFFKQRNKVLNEYFSKEETLNGIMDIIFEDKSHSAQLVCLQIFMSTNQTVIKLFLGKTKFVEQLFIKLDEENASVFLVGIITQILQKMLLNFSEEFFSLMDGMEIGYFSLLKNLENDSIYNLCTQIVKTPPSSAHKFLWGFLVAFCENMNEIKEIRETIKIPSVQKCMEIELNPVQKLRVLKLFTSFSNTFKSNNEFKGFLFGIMMELVKLTLTDDEKCELLQIGLSFELCNFPLMDLSYQVMVSTTSNGALIQQAIKYISYQFSKKSLVEPIVQFLFNILQEDSNLCNVFVLYDMNNLIEVILQRIPKRSAFVKLLQHCIIYSWNMYSEKLMIRSFLIKLGILIINEKPTMQEWKLFVENILKPFERKEIIDRDSKFDEGNISIEHIYSLLCKLDSNICSLRAKKSLNTINISDIKKSSKNDKSMKMKRSNSNERLSKKLKDDKRKQQCTIS